MTVTAEPATDLAAPTWSRLARLNDTLPSLESFAPGGTQSTDSLPKRKTRYALTLPPTAGSAGFLRLRVAQERHALDP